MQLLLKVIFLAIISSFNADGKHSGRILAGESPFTAKASLMRYWKKHISGNNSPTPFFLSKASPLNAVSLATFSKLAGQRRLTTAQLSRFCKEANLLCFTDAEKIPENHSKDANFADYRFKNFTSYGTGGVNGVDSFKNYTGKTNSFRRYSRESINHGDKFDTYSFDINLLDQSFDAYGAKSTGGAGDFNTYIPNGETRGLTFTSYSDRTNGRTQEFTLYSEQANDGAETFTGYGKNGTNAANGFHNYGNKSNEAISVFNNYGETASGAADNFTSYGVDGNLLYNNFTSYGSGGDSATEAFTSYGFNANNPKNNFKGYGLGGTHPTQTFKTYRDRSNVGDDSFEAYGGAKSKSAAINFSSYGKSFNLGSDTFKGYAQGSKGDIGFETYGDRLSFEKYDKTGVNFANYLNTSGNILTNEKQVNLKIVNNGKFFREKMLKTGTMMPMPDIRDKMPKRSFLPRAILSKLPFSSGEIEELKGIFSAANGSSLSGILIDALRECERAPSAGETKRCAGSGEDMIDFATSVLGENVVVRTTENTRGSGGEILIGDVTGINGGKITKSVSCHQSLYPYLLYYCHSVPKVRLYEANILDMSSKVKINRGVAICHIDTSMWSQTHAAFAALGSGPGRIEVCHWIFENDMTWTLSD